MGEPAVAGLFERRDFMHDPLGGSNHESPRVKPVEYGLLMEFPTRCGGSNLTPTLATMGYFFVI
jgi:hypothetical protein